MEFNKQDGVKQSSKGEWGVGWGEGLWVTGGLGMKRIKKKLYKYKTECVTVSALVF